MTDADDILQTAFKKVNPDPGNDYHPTIKYFLEETLDLLAADKMDKGRFLRLKRTRVTTCPNIYMGWAQIGFSNLIFMRSPLLARVSSSKHH